MSDAHSLLVFGHIAVGAVALVLFWVPAVAQKGSRLHVAAGRWYTLAMYGVCVTALFASTLVLLDPLAVRHPGERLDAAEAERMAGLYRSASLFLLMLAVLVFASVRHGVAALRARAEPGALGTPAQRVTLLLLALLGVAVGIAGFGNGQWLFVIFAAISINAAFGMWRDLNIADPGPRELTWMHLNGLIGSGVGAYTAFAAFGGDRFLGGLLPGQWQILPWVLPAIVGTIVTFRLGRRYRPRQRTALAR